MYYGALWCMGVTVIVHSCMHNEHQPSAGFILDDPFLLDFFFHFWQLFLLLRTRKGAQGALRSRA